MKVRTSDIWSSSFWLLFSILLFIESYKLGIGKYYDPGPGFLPFLIGVAFGILSLGLLMMTLRTKRQCLKGEILQEVRWTNVTFILASMLTYGFFLEKLGFVASTFVFIGALLWIIERKKWYIVIIIASITALLSYVVFELFLHAHLPKGIFGV